jgi:glycosyl transferase family 25
MTSGGNAPDIWPVRVINMDGATARMAKAEAALAAQEIAFERFPAVVGAKLSADERAAVYDEAANRTRFRHRLIGPELGCYLSHVALWRQLLASDAPGMVILEDDFAAAPHLAASLAALAADGGDWDMVKLYTRRPEARTLSTRPLIEGVALADPYQIPNTTLGYVIRRAAAGRLLERLVPFSRPIDEDLKRFWEHGCAIRILVPPPLSFGEEASDAASIGKARRDVLRGGLAQGWRNLSYRIGYLARLYWHRLIGTGR